VSYQQPRNTRREINAPSDRFRTGKLVPVCAVPIEFNESGMLSQSISLELDPIAGRMKSPIYAEFIAVFVPEQAIQAIKFPEQDHAGLTDVIRQVLTEGNPIVDLENEGEITKRCGINPIGIGSDKMTRESIRLAHNAAVNHLRRELWYKATPLAGTNTAITPALLSSTILDRMNGVLDPDEMINGAVELSLPAMSLPVVGLVNDPTLGPDGSTTLKRTDVSGTPANPDETDFRNVYVDDTAAYPKVVATLNAVTAGNVSLSDFFRAEKRDKLVREMDQIIRDNPQYGKEMVIRWAAGLAVDTGKTCFVMARERRQFGNNVVDAMDSAGVLDETIRSDMGMMMNFTVPIPRTEFGGVIITFCSVKPDERVRSMPHPIFSHPKGAVNYLADELKIDPVPVTLRELDSDISSGSQATVSMYTGYQALKQAYVNYGYTRNFDTETVEAQTSIWQLEVPLSVTPDTILYPDDFPQYPWADQEAEVVRYDLTSVATIRTPMIFGPSPVEDIGNSENMFTDEIEDE